MIVLAGGPREVCQLTYMSRNISGCAGFLACGWGIGIGDMRFDRIGRGVGCCVLLAILDRRIVVVGLT
jgi:hypothetical protein